MALVRSHKSVARRLGVSRYFVLSLAARNSGLVHCHSYDLYAHHACLGDAQRIAWLAGRGESQLGCDRNRRDDHHAGVMDVDRGGHLVAKGARDR